MVFKSLESSKDEILASNLLGILTKTF
uniref:Uncharacterized protein n=1 Tax=Rhizophora mucronata TaxID=61149 RepID=A0A2P2PL51_RHIMU